MLQQVTSMRFTRNQNLDLAVTFLPIVTALGLRGLFQSMDLPETGFLLAQIALAAFLVGCFVLVFRCYFRSFRYVLTAAGGDRRGGYPPNALTFEQVLNKRVRPYECVRAGEMLALDAPGEDAGSALGRPKRTFLLTVRSRRTAYRLYYRQQGTLYCAVFHPDEQMAAALRRWLDHPPAN